MEFEYLLKYPNLKRSIVEGAFATIMLGAGMAFVVPYAILLGATDIQIAYLVAFPALLGAIAQLFSVKLLDMYQSRKWIVVICVLFQALSFIPIIFIPFVSPLIAVNWLIFFYTLSVVIAAMAGPLWQSWMKSLIPDSILGTYFGLRNSIVEMVAFIALLIFGVVLSQAVGDQVYVAFSAIFTAALIGRFCSTIIFTTTYEPPYHATDRVKTKQNPLVGFWEFVHEIRKNNFGIFVLYASLMTFGVSLVGPFFSVYILEGLGVNYFMYTILLSASSIASLISMPYWGQLIDRYGNVKVLKATSLLLCTYPLTLMVIRDPFLLLFTEFISGMIFAGFSLVIANFIYKASSQSHIIRYASYQAVFIGVAACAGYLVSGYVQSTGITFGYLTTPFMVVCFGAVIIRYSVYRLFIDRIKEVRSVESIHSKQIAFSVLTFTPIREVGFRNAAIFFTSAPKEAAYVLHKVKEVEEEGIAAVRKMENLVEEDAIEPLKRDIVRAEVALERRGLKRVDARLAKLEKELASPKKHLTKRKR